jgi:hypothetical protein
MVIVRGQGSGVRGQGAGVRVEKFAGFQHVIFSIRTLAVMDLEDKVIWTSQILIGDTEKNPSTSQV